MLSLLGVIVSLGLLMYLAFKGYSIIWVAPLVSAIVALTGGMNILDSYSSTYMVGLVGFIQQWFPVFLLSTIFGQFMDYCGFTKSIAVWMTQRVSQKYVIAMMFTLISLLVYGGVAVFVVVFAVYPLVVALFREANISRTLIPGIIDGAAAFSMAIPGSPQIQNLLPGQYLGTPPSAAPILGLIASVIWFGGAVGYLTWRKNKLQAKGLGFTEPKKLESANIEGEVLPNPIVSVLPMVAVVLSLNVLPHYLNMTAGSTNSIILGLVIGIVLCMIFGWKKNDHFTTLFSKGSQGAVTAILNTSAVVGFGAVVAVVPGFQKLTEMVLSIPGGPLVSLAIAINVLAGATGSASGGMGIVFKAMGDKWIAMANSAGISLEVLHRTAAVSAGALDSLPHNGVVVTMLNHTENTHKSAYFHMFITSIVVPLVSIVVMILLGTLGVV